MSDVINAAILSQNVPVGTETSVTIDGVTYSGMVYGSFADAAAASTTVAIDAVAVDGATGVTSLSSKSVVGTDGAAFENTAHFDTAGSVTISGVSFSGAENAAAGAVFRSGQGVVLTISDAVFSGNNTTQGGGAIYDAGGTVTLTNVTFSDNHGNGGWGGGAIYAGNGTLSLENVTFAGNSTAMWGGALFTYTNETVHLKNVTFSGNTSSKGSLGGGAIHNRGAAIIIDGLVTLATASDTLVNYTGTTGTYSVSAHALDSGGQTLYFNKFLSVAFANGYESLISAETGYTIVKSGNDLYLKQDGAPYTEAGIVSAAGDIYQTTVGGTTYAGPGYADLAAALTANAVVAVTDSSVSGVSGTFSNKTIVGAAGAELTDTRLQVGGTFSLSDLTFADADNAQAGAALRASSGATLTIDDAIFSGNKTTQGGGAIYSDGSSITLTDVTFAGNRGDGGWGGGAIFAGGGTLTLEDVSFAGNATAMYGGALALLNNEIAHLRNVTFDGNASTKGGGAIYNNSGAVTVDGLVTLATSSDTLVRAGTGTYTVSSEALDSLFVNKFLSVGFANSYETMFSAGTGYSVVKSGNDLYIRQNAGDYTFAGIVSGAGDVYQTTVGGTTYAGPGYADLAAALTANAVVAVTDSSVSGVSGTFSNKTIVGAAGAGFTDTRLQVGGVFTLSGLTFADADNTQAGAAIRASSGATLTIDDAIFSGNKTTSGGGAIYDDGSSITLTGVTFAGNRGDGGWGGGAIFAGGGTLTLEDVSFTGNATAMYGGALALLNNETAHLKNVTFDGNTSTSGGGAIYNRNATVIIDGLVTLATASDTLVRAGDNGRYYVSGEALQSGDETLAFNKFLSVGFTNAYEGVVFGQAGYRVLKYGNDLYVAAATTNFSDAVFSATGDVDELEVAGETVSGVAFDFDQIDMAKAWNAVNVAFDGYEASGNFTVFSDRTVNVDAVVALKDVVVGGHYYSYDAGSTVNGNVTLLADNSTFGGSVYGFGGGIASGDVVVKIDGSTISGNLSATSSVLGQSFGSFVAEIRNSTIRGTLRGTGSTAEITFQNSVISLDHSSVNDIICLYGSGARTGNRLEGAVSITLDGSAVGNGIFRQNAAYQTANDSTITLSVRGSDASEISGGISDLDEITIDSGATLKLLSGCTSVRQSFVVDGTLELHGDASAIGVTVEAGAGLRMKAATTAIDDTTVKAGGSLEIFSGADTGEKLTLDFSGATTGGATNINDLSRIDASTQVFVAGLEDSYGVFTLGSGATGSETFTLFAGGGNDYELDGTLTSVVDAFTGKTYTKSVEAGSLKLTAAAGTHTIATVGAAGALVTAGATLNGDDREAKWTSTTAAANQIYLASGMTAGNAWLEIDGYDGSATNLFGAANDDTFADGAVNINVKNGTLKNLAAGGGNGGTVKNVNLSFGDGAHVSGTTFAGGQGNVEGAAKTLIDGGTFGGVFVAGAFSNRIDTAVGSVEITIDGGSFDGNVYGGSQVRYAAGRTNTVGSISVNLNDVDSVKTGFSIFAGGMAAGSDASKSANAYEVTGDISVNVTGGNWCNNVASGGRGLFGGIFAGDSGTTKTGVKAEVAGSVNIIIDGGCLGNVYGGGWAQKGGVSVVDNVSITVNGGEIVNVFGGGSHSTTSGGTTLVSNGVNITVEGGNIAGSIYARGQLTGDTVNGDATVTFTSRANSEYSCGVYGYSMEEAILANSGDSYLVFDGYKGTLTDSIGGFYAIRFQGDAMVCFTADRKSTLPLHPTYGPIDPAAVATVQNGVWDFDLSARGAAFASDAVLTWSGDMSANEVTLHFADDAGAVDSWTIATGLADVADCYAIDIAGAGITAELGVAITGTGTDYDNKWAVVFEDNTLKFAKITA